MGVAFLVASPERVSELFFFLKRDFIFVSFPSLLFLFFSFLLDRLSGLCTSGSSAGLLDEAGTGGSEGKGARGRGAAKGARCVGK